MSKECKHDSLRFVRNTEKGSEWECQDCGATVSRDDVMPAFIVNAMMGGAGAPNIPGMPPMGVPTMNIPKGKIVEAEYEEVDN